MIPVSLALEFILSLLLGLFLYILPGLALLSWFWRGKPLSWGEKLGLASGLGVALYPILFLWFYVFGLAPGPLYSWVPGALAICALLWRYRKNLRKRPSWGAKISSWRPRWAHMPHFVLLVVISLLLVTRLAVIRNMTAPAWGDSVHHTFIVQLMLDNDGLFQSWEPYASITSFSYHFGLHALMAVWAWLSGFVAPQAVLSAGQVLNVLAILALYPLAFRLSGSRWAGIAAMVVAGLFSPMPAFYVNWGRYPQLASLIILPVALWFFDVWWTSEERPAGRTLVLFFILLSGLSLIHYSMAFVVIMAAVSWALWSLWQQRRRIREWLARTLQFGGASLVSALSVVPWIIIVLSGRIPWIFEKMTVSGEKSYITGDVVIWKHTDIYFSDLFWVFGLGALALAFLMRQRLAFPIAIWCSLSFLVTNPYLLGLPGPGWITNFALIIALYIPIGLLLGWLIGFLWNWLSFYRVGKVLVLISLVLLLGIGTRIQLRIIDPFFQTVEPTDMAAFEWIKVNVSDDARFLVNGFLVFDETTVVGSDAGWWLPYYTLRASTLPPILYILEQTSHAADRNRLRQIAHDLRESNGEEPVLREILCRDGVTHVFLGEKRGSVGYGAKALVPEAWLRDNNDFSLLFQKGKAQVWRFDRSRCQ